MNSIYRHLGPESIAATLKTMRSGTKNVILIVEGGDDIALLSTTLSLDRSNFVDCRGKENLDGVLGLAPHPGIDGGTIFVRDRDHDGIASMIRNGIALCVTDYYDIEMHLLSGRLFDGILSEFLRAKATAAVLAASFATMLEAAAWVGALRLLAKQNGWPLKFDGLEFDFVSRKTLAVDVTELVRLVSARSQVNVGDHDDLIATMARLLVNVPHIELASGKDLLEVLHVALHGHFRCAKSSECSSDMLGKLLRIAAVQDDLRPLTLYRTLAAQVAGTTFAWTGNAL